MLWKRPLLRSLGGIRKAHSVCRKRLAPWVGDHGNVNGVFLRPEPDAFLQGLVTVFDNGFRGACLLKNTRQILRDSFTWHLCADAQADKFSVGQLNGRASSR